MTIRRTPSQLQKAVRRVAKLAAATAMLAAVVTTSGCYSYSVETPDSAPINEYREHDITASSSFWGIVEDDPVIAKRCEGEALDQVRVNNNYGYALITVLTLGLYSPMDVNYRCAEKVVQEDSGM
jgi:hypothetical protein